MTETLEMDFIPRYISRKFVPTKRPSIALSVSLLVQIFPPIAMNAEENISQRRIYSLISNGNFQTLRKGSIGETSGLLFVSNIRPTKCSQQNISKSYVAVIFYFSFFL